MRSAPDIRGLFCVSLLSLALAACGGGGGGDGGGGGGGGGGATTPPAPAVTNNLAATALQVVTPNPQIAYPLAVSVSITASEATDDVSVSLFAIEKNDDPNVEIRQIPLGSRTIARVEAGAGSYELDTNIPSSVEFPGAYFIAAIVDPVGEITETDESDNTASIETTLAPEGGPNVLLKDVALDRTVLDVNTSTYAQQVPGTADNVHNADAGGTITVGADGLAVNETINLEAFAKLRLTRSDKGTSHDVPLYLWNSDANRYMDAYGVDPDGTVLAAEEWLPVGQFAPQLVETAGGESTLDDLNRDSVHVNFYFPGKLGSELVIAMRHLPVVLSPGPTVPPPDLTAAAIDSLRSFLFGLPSNGITGDESAAMAVMSFAICVEIRPADPAVVDRVPDDNEICTPVTINLPPIAPTPPTPAGPPGFTPRFSTLSGPAFASDGLSTKAGGSAFAFGLDFGSSASADYRGYIEEMHGGLPITIFGANIDFMNIGIRAQLVPDYAGKPATEESGYKLEMRFNGALLTSKNLPATSGPALSESYSKEAPDPERPYQAFVGPVPVIGGASVAGNFGVEYEFEFTDDPTEGYTFGNSVGPFVNVEATVYAGVGTPLFSAGVEGVLRLLDERLTLFSGTEIEVVDDGFQSGVPEFVITRGEKLSNEFTGPKGFLNLYAKYTVPGFKTCNWGFIKGKCPSPVTLKATKNIWSSKALFHIKDVLLEDDDLELDVVAIPGEEPAYYVRP